MLNQSLWFFLRGHEFWSESNQLLIPLIVVDQFEEIFTKSGTDTTIQEFLQEIDDLTSVLPPLYIRNILEEEDIDIENPLGIRFVFSLREDFVPRLDDYVYDLDIDELKKSRFCISLMTKEQAISVIEKPNKEIIGGGVTDTVLSILTSKASILNRRKQIEPFLLSLFMYRLYIKTKEKNQNVITTDVVNTFGPNIVADYYKESMNKVSLKALMFLEDTLLTTNGYRDSVSLDKLTRSRRISSKEIDTLLKTRIIKQDCINEVDRIEFTHDVLAVVAAKNRDKRKNNKRLQKIIGSLGLLFSFILCTISCWKLSFMLSSISILFVLPLISMSLYFLGGGKNNAKEVRNITLYNICIGVLFVIVQLSCKSAIIYLVIAEILGLFATYKLTKTIGTKETKYIITLKCILIWGVLYTIIPNITLGYNQFVGLSLSRDVSFSLNEFYIKDKSGYLGLRDRFSILKYPEFDSYLNKTNSNFIFSHDNKFGVLDRNYAVIIEPSFDSIHVENDVMYPYLAGKEVFENGLAAKWDENIWPIQKDVIRKIINNMVFVKGGTFVMGRSKFDNALDEHPVLSEDVTHKVTLSDYYINKYELTMEEWITIMNYNPCDDKCQTKTSSDKCPVHNITFQDCLRFVEKLNRLAGIEFSLPTEARWEYAARGGTKSKDFKYSGSDNPTDCGWLIKNSNNTIHRVGEVESWKNELGLYDMTGNVSEWCMDFMSDSFYKESDNSKDPVCLSQDRGNKRIIRGGSYDTRKMNNCRNTSRQFTTSSGHIKYSNIGIRLVAESINNSTKNQE